VLETCVADGSRSGMMDVVYGLLLLALPALCGAECGPTSTTKECHCIGGSIKSDREKGFKCLIDRMTEVYPYTVWRKLSWGALLTEYQAKIKKAGKSNAAFYSVMKDFTTDIHDGHCFFTWDGAGEGCGKNPKQAAQGADIGKGYGVIFNMVIPEGSMNPNVLELRIVYADKVTRALGVNIGDQITHISNVAAKDHIRTLNYRWAFPVPATAGAIEAERIRFLSRTGGGNPLQLKLSTGGAIQLPSRTEDETLSGTVPYTDRILPISCIATRVINASGGYAVQGYMQIGSFTSANECAALESGTKDAIALFKKHNAKTIIVDLRGNIGGDDVSIPKLLRFFFSAPLLYEQVAVLSSYAKDAKLKDLGTAGDFRVTGRYSINPAPLKERWTGSVVVLVNRHVASNGDVAAYLFKRAGARIVGLEGTSGSVSGSGGIIKMPCIKFQHTIGQSWDKNSKIQLEANGDLRGGVEPTDPVPRTLENLVNYTSWELYTNLGFSTFPPEATDVVLAFARTITPVSAPARSVTVKGYKSGQYTFNTVFVTKKCGDLVQADLPHLSGQKVTTIAARLVKDLGAATLCVAVFGILVVNNMPASMYSNYDANAWTVLFANTISKILDTNQIGVVDDPAVERIMKTKPDGFWIFGRAASTSDAIEDGLKAIIGQTVTIKQAEDFGAAMTAAASMRAMTEEIFHTYQTALGLAHPKIFGVTGAGCPKVSERRLASNGLLGSAKDFLRKLTGQSQSSIDQSGKINHFKYDNGLSNNHIDRKLATTCSGGTGPQEGSQTGCNFKQSLLTECSYIAMCNWYTAQMCCSEVGRPTSDGSKVVGGGCTKPTCASIEWYYNLLFEYSETVYDFPRGSFPIGAGYKSNLGKSLTGGLGFPDSRAKVIEQLTYVGGACKSFLDAFTNEKYFQPLKPFDWNYVISLVVCESDCARCSDAVTCTECGSFKYLHKMDCYTSCPAGVYPSGTTEKGRTCKRTIPKIDEANSPGKIGNCILEKFVADAPSDLYAVSNWKAEEKLNYPPWKFAMGVYGHIHLIETSGMQTATGNSGVAFDAAYEEKACWIAFMQAEMFTNNAFFPVTYEAGLQQRGVLTQMWRHRGATDLFMNAQKEYLETADTRSKVGWCGGYDFSKLNPVVDWSGKIWQGWLLNGISFQWPKDWGIQITSVVYKEAWKAANSGLWPDGIGVFWSKDSDEARKTTLIQEFFSVVMHAWCNMEPSKDQEAACRPGQLKKCSLGYIDRKMNVGIRNKAMLKKNIPKMHDLISKTVATIMKCPTLGTIMQIRKLCKAGTQNTSAGNCKNQPFCDKRNGCDFSSGKVDKCPLLQTDGSWKVPETMLTKQPTRRAPYDVVNKKSIYWTYKGPEGRWITIRGMKGDAYTFMTNFTLKPCKDIGVGDLEHLGFMTAQTISSTLGQKLTKDALCIAIFGVLLASDIADRGNFSNHNWTLFMANTLASVLDHNKDGWADDGKVIAKMRSGPLPGGGKGCWIPALGALTRINANSLFTELGGGHVIDEGNMWDFKKSVYQAMDRITEEITHTWQSFGIARAHPALFGVTSVPSCVNCKAFDAGTAYKCYSIDGCNYTSSVLMRCLRKSVCNWYTPTGSENGVQCNAVGPTCTGEGSGKCLTGGDCGVPGCLGVEWYYNLMLEWSGQGTGYDYDVGTLQNRGVPFPRTKAAVEERMYNLSSDCTILMKAMKDTKRYHQMDRPLGHKYTSNMYGIATTTTTTTTTTGPSTTTSTTTTSTTREWALEPMNRYVVEKTYFIAGMSGGAMNFKSIYHPKACKNLKDWELPHIPQKNVSLMAKAIAKNYGDNSLCVVVFKRILVICNIKDVAGYKNLPWCALEANILSEIMDNNYDGVPDDPAVAENLRTEPNKGHYLFLRSSSLLAKYQDLMVPYLGTTVTIRQEIDFTASSKLHESRQSMVESTFHLWQHALGKTYPKVFGIVNTNCPADMQAGRGGVLHEPSVRRRVRRLTERTQPPRHQRPAWAQPRSSWQSSKLDHTRRRGTAAARSLQLDSSNCPFGQKVAGCNWQTSVLLKCAWKAMCNWYTADLCCKKVGQWGSANDIWDQGGYCSSPQCAGIEFFYNLLTEWGGHGTGYNYNVGEMLKGGKPFPRTRFAVETVLRNMDGPCQDLLDAMHNSSYALLSTALYFNYAPISMTRTTTFTTTTSTTSSSTTSTTTTSSSTTQTQTTTTSTSTTLPLGLAALVKGSLMMSVMSPITFITDPVINLAVSEALAATAQIPNHWIKVVMKKVVSRWLKAQHPNARKDGFRAHRRSPKRRRRWFQRSTTTTTTGQSWERARHGRSFKNAPAKRRPQKVGHQNHRVSHQATAFTRFQRLTTTTTTTTAQPWERARHGHSIKKALEKRRPQKGLHGSASKDFRRARRRLKKVSVQVDYAITVPSGNKEKKTGYACLDAIMAAPLSNISKVMRSRVYNAIRTTAGISVTSRTQPTLDVTEFVPTTTVTTVFRSNRTAVKTLANVASRCSLHVVTILSAAIFCSTYVTTLCGC